VTEQLFFFSYAHSGGFGNASITFRHRERLAQFELTWADIETAVEEIIKLGAARGSHLRGVVIIAWQPMQAARWVDHAPTSDVSITGSETG
jgi:hypothetical protein